MKRDPVKMPIEEWLHYHRSTIYYHCNKFWKRRGMVDNDEHSPTSFLFLFDTYCSPGEMKCNASPSP